MLAAIESFITACELSVIGVRIGFPDAAVADRRGQRGGQQMDERRTAQTRGQQRQEDARRAGIDHMPLYSFRAIIELQTLGGDFIRYAIREGLYIKLPVSLSPGSSNRC